MEVRDYVKWFVDDLISNSPLPQSNTCQHWINETVFLFTSDAQHIYFRFLAYYSIHKSLLDHHVEPGNYRIFRLTEGYNYIFPDYEQVLFPGLEKITDLPDESYCFKKVVLVPRCYSTILFQCKMTTGVRAQCLKCDGRSLTGTSLMSFRSRVLKACGLSDSPKAKNEPKFIAVILRKPYNRYRKDQPTNFKRVLTNSEELITSLKTSFPDFIIKPLHMEDLTVCQQVSYTHDADFLIGVHGAGLVHLWWLREEAVMIELEPHYEKGNPSFRTLAKLTGRHYEGIPIDGTASKVHVNVHNVINKIKSLL